jgi:hypothetical protein
MSKIIFNPKSGTYSDNPNSPFQSYGTSSLDFESGLTFDQTYAEVLAARGLRELGITHFTDWASSALKQFGVELPKNQKPLLYNFVFQNYGGAITREEAKKGFSVLEDIFDINLFNDVKEASGNNVIFNSQFVQTYKNSRIDDKDDKAFITRKGGLASSEFSNAVGIARSILGVRTSKDNAIRTALIEGFEHFTQVNAKIGSASIDLSEKAFKEYLQAINGKNGKGSAQFSAFKFAYDKPQYFAE